MEKILTAVFIFTLLLPTKTFAAEAKVLRIPLHVNSINLDPTGVQDASSLWVSRQINCQLVRLKGRNFIPEAASSIQYISPNEIRLPISPTAQFHDGSPVLAEDVVATFEHLKKERRVIRNIFSKVKKIRALNPTTVVIELKSPVPQFLKFLGAPNYAIFKKSFIKKAEIHPELWESPLGCGGYKVTLHSKSIGILRLTPIRDGYPIEFHLKQTKLLSQAENDFFDILGPPFSDSVTNHSAYREEGVFDPKQLLLGLNTTLPRWKNKENRCEFFRHIDRLPLIKKYGKAAELANSLFPRGVLGYNPTTKISFLSESPTSQKKLKSPICFVFLGVSVPKEDRNSYLDIIRNHAPDITTKVLDSPSDYGLTFLKTKCDIFVIGLKSNYLDGYEYLLNFSESPANFTGYENNSLIAEIRESQNSDDPSTRSIRYQAIERNINEQCIVAPLITFSMKKTFVKKRLQTLGLGEGPLNEYFLGFVK